MDQTFDEAIHRLTVGDRLLVLGHLEGMRIDVQMTEHLRFGRLPGTLRSIQEEMDGIGRGYAGHWAEEEDDGA